MQQSSSVAALSRVGFHVEQDSQLKTATSLNKPNPGLCTSLAPVHSKAPDRDPPPLTAHIVPMPSLLSLYFGKLHSLTLPPLPPSPPSPVRKDSLYELFWDERWQEATQHIYGLADSDAAKQLACTDGKGFTTLMVACHEQAPFELVQLMIQRRDRDSSVLAIKSRKTRRTALHLAACNHPDPSVLELLIREHPLALLATSAYGTPLADAIALDRPQATISLLAAAAAALTRHDFKALASQVRGDERALRRRALDPSR